jgi:hypothetical protein
MVPPLLPLLAWQQVVVAQVVWLLPFKPSWSSASPQTSWAPSTPLAAAPLLRPSWMAV